MAMTLRLRPCKTRHLASVFGNGGRSSRRTCRAHTARKAAGSRTMCGRQTQHPAGIAAPDAAGMVGAVTTGTGRKAYVRSRQLPGRLYMHRCATRLGWLFHLLRACRRPATSPSPSSVAGRTRAEVFPASVRRSKFTARWPIASPSATASRPTSSRTEYSRRARRLTRPQSPRRTKRR